MSVREEEMEWERESGAGGRGGGERERAGAHARTCMFHLIKNDEYALRYAYVRRRNGYAALLGNICEGVVGVGADTTRLLRLFGRV